VKLHAVLKIIEEIEHYFYIGGVYERFILEIEKFNDLMIFMVSLFEFLLTHK
jgi:hypothetical protein